MSAVFFQMKKKKSKTNFETGWMEVWFYINNTKHAFIDLVFQLSHYLIFLKVQLTKGLQTLRLDTIHILE